MNITLINSIFRFLLLIPLFLVFKPIFKSYWEKKNTINGLRQTRFVMIVLVCALIVSNFYFMVFSFFKISRATTFSQVIVIVDKTINLFAYWLLYHLFRHARKHTNTKMEIEDNKNIKIIKSGVKKLNERKI